MNPPETKPALGRAIMIAFGLLFLATGIGVILVGLYAKNRTEKYRIPAAELSPGTNRPASPPRP